ncbi:MAG: chemotaxis protein CheB [Gammaproteobacteria bacterium]|nr:chemotaxis protein CheB [Gammaproteobacteria bacterium]
MLEPKIATTTKVAVFASSQNQRQLLQTMLEQNGLEVVVSEAIGEKFLTALKKNPPDVLLIDLRDDEDEDLDFLDILTGQSSTPILFNDSGPEGVSLAASGDNWAKKLAGKLTEMANGAKAVEKSPADETPFPMVNPQIPKTPAATPDVFAGATVNQTPAKTKTPVKSVGPEKAVDNADINVWVLGASLGGPQAVRQFLAAIQEDLPVVFILAQHIGANHVSLLAEQLNRVTAFDVLPGKTGHKLKHGEVILTPADKQLSITKDGFLALTQAPPATIYSPSIDNVMIEVARCYGQRSGTIVFSGMGDDGARGCEAIAENGGIVWAQDIASCVVSSMPDQARKTGKVSYSANPEQLARHLYEFYRKAK